MFENCFSDFPPIFSRFSSNLFSSLCAKVLSVFVFSFLFRFTLGYLFLTFFVAFFLRFLFGFFSFFFLSSRFYIISSAFSDIQSHTIAGTIQSSSFFLHLCFVSLFVFRLFLITDILSPVFYRFIFVTTFYARVFTVKQLYHTHQPFAIESRLFISSERPLKVNQARPCVSANSNTARLPYER